MMKALFRHSLVSCIARFLGVLILPAFMAGCATGPTAQARDPIEPFNRSMFQFNEAFDESIFKPVATAYRDVLPVPIRHGVSNFFGNLTDAWSFVNNVLQFKPQGAVDSLFRVSVNTVFGLGGLLDIATEAGIERHPEDLGQTLGRWGVPSGPYLVLPILGPSTVRDALALELDTTSTLIYGIDHVPTRNSAVLLQAVDTRAALLRAGDLLDQAALDKYSFTRDVYLRKRRNDIFDGNPPEDAEESK